MKTIALTIILMAIFSFAFADDLDGYTLLKISGVDARAVVKTPDGEKQLVSPGDLLGDATITEITADRVVLEQLGSHGKAVLIATVKNGLQHISRLQRMLVQEKLVDVDQGKNSKQFGQ